MNILQRRVIATLAISLSATAVASAQSAAGGAMARKGAATIQGSNYARQQINQIVAQDIGTGFSGQSLNQLTLSNIQAQIPNAGQQTTRGGIPNFNLGSSPTLASKPFTGFSPEPTVSPYLNLFREDFDGNGDLNYSTLVRPQLQQQQFNSNVQRQNMEMARKVQAISAQPDFNPRGSESQYPTGHPTVFMYHGRYYPGLQARRGR